MLVSKQIEIDTSINKVWQILGKDFANPHKWASPVKHSEGKGKQIASLACDERACQTTMGKVREKITHYSDEEHSLSWDIVEGMPPFVENARNTWSLRKLSDSKTILQIKMDVKLRSWAIFMFPMAKMMFNKLAVQLSEDFAYYAENGKPHPRKIKAMEKNKSGKRGLINFYFIAFILGTAIPLYFIVQFIFDAGRLDIIEFVNQLFANYAASTFSSDLLICSFIFWVFMANDKKGTKIPNLLYFVLLNLTIGLSTAMPLYFFFRERERGHQPIE